jgi:hypothetical protein
MTQTEFKTIENLEDQMHIRHNDPIKEKQPGGEVLTKEELNLKLKLKVLTMEAKKPN